MKNLKLIFILLIAAAFRWYNNTAIALWHDEAFSALYIKYSWSEMMYRIGLDVHPPLYYWVLRLWSYIFGSSLLSLRGLSILLGVLTVWAGYKFVLYAFKNEKAAAFSALLLAINPFQAQYALEARMYTLGTLLILASSWILLKALEANRRRDWIWFGILSAASIYTHYYLVFSVMAQELYIIFYLVRHKAIRFDNVKNNILVNAAGSIVLSLILFLPWLSVFNQQRSRVQDAFWIPKMDTWSIPGTFWKMFFGGPGINRGVLFAATIAAIVVLIYFVRKTKEESKWLVVLSIAVPFAAAIGISLQTAIYLDRYFVFAALFMIIAAAIVIMHVPRFTIRRSLAVILAIVTAIVFFKNWSELDVKGFGDDQVKKPGMAAAAEFINERAGKNDEIYFGSSFVYFTFKYYNQTGIAPLLYSSGPLETIPHFSGTAILTNEDLVLDFNQAKKNDTVWLVWTTGFGGSKPNVPGNWQMVSENGFEDAPGFKGWIIVTQYYVN